MNSRVFNDEALARQLQEEYDRKAAEHLDEEKTSHLILQKPGRGQARVEHFLQTSPNSDLSPVDPSLEFTDPNPDIRVLFLLYNENYFGGRLSGIEVKWSPRMTLCAGLCVYEGDGGLCSVRLSLPLLKLRPRKDLVETLLHEMIHAYLFITNNDRDHDGHGPNFQKHMHRINNATGANITIYHTFHDEVSSYQQHWWRCNGHCQFRKPYFGYVKRAMNRAPSSNDFWWAEHRATCGGTYTKIKEPEGYGKKKADVKKDQEKNGGIDIRPFVGKGQKMPPPKTSKDESKMFNTMGNSGNSVHTGSFISKGNVTGKLPSKSNLPSTSKHVVVGGILVPKSSLKQSSLFTSVSTSSFPIPPSLPGTSHSVNSTKRNVTNPVPIQSIRKQMKIEDAHHKMPTTERPVKVNEKSESFQVTRKKTFRHQGQKEDSILSYHQGKRNHMFPKNFRSVCEARVGQKSHNEGKKEKRKYVFDEVDEDDGLWDLDDQMDVKERSIDKEEELSSSKLLSSSLSLQKLKDCKLPKEECFSQNHEVKREIFDETSPVKWDQPGPSSTGHQHSSYKHSIEHYFPGKGCRLGYEHSANAKSNVKHAGSGASILHNTEVPELKRSFSNAFSATVIDISDDDEDKGMSFPVFSKKHKKEYTHTNISLNFTSRSESDNGYAGAIATGKSDTAAFSDLSEDPENNVSCPACSVKIFRDSINSHLDMCLLRA